MKAVVDSGEENLGIWKRLLFLETHRLKRCQGMFESINERGPRGGGTAEADDGADSPRMKKARLTRKAAKKRRKRPRPAKPGMKNAQRTSQTVIKRMPDVGSGENQALDAMIKLPGTEGTEESQDLRIDGDAGPGPSDAKTPPTFERQGKSVPIEFAAWLLNRNKDTLQRIGWVSSVSSRARSRQVPASVRHAMTTGNCEMRRPKRIQTWQGSSPLMIRKSRRSGLNGQERRRRNGSLPRIEHQPQFCESLRSNSITTALGLVNMMVEAMLGLGK